MKARFISLAGVLIALAAASVHADTKIFPWEIGRCNFPMYRAAKAPASHRVYPGGFYNKCRQSVILNPPGTIPHLLYPFVRKTILSDPFYLRLFTRRKRRYVEAGKNAGFCQLHAPF